MNSPTNHRAAFAHGSESRWNQCSDRCKDDGPIQRLRGRLIRAAGPDCPEPTRELLRDGVACSCEGEDFTLLIMCDLRHNMSGRTKPIETEPLCISGLAQRAIPN